MENETLGSCNIQKKKKKKGFLQNIWPLTPSPEETDPRLNSNDMGREESQCFFFLPFCLTGCSNELKMKLPFCLKNPSGETEGRQTRPSLEGTICHSPVSHILATSSSPGFLSSSQTVGGFSCFLSILPRSSELELKIDGWTRHECMCTPKGPPVFFKFKISCQFYFGWTS